MAPIKIAPKNGIDRRNTRRISSSRPAVRPRLCRSRLTQRTGLALFDRMIFPDCPDSPHALNLTN